jgi:hypothetical protein
MRRRSRAIRVSVLLLALAGVQARAAEPDRDPASSATRPFPDFGHLPSGYRGRVFTLSQDYPSTLPDEGKIPPFFGPDSPGDWVEGYLRGNWKSYMLEVRRYCFEGNLEADWRPEENAVRRWYHMPWQHYGPTGREGIRGMTKEAEVKKYQLAPAQTYVGGQTYAVAFYNEFGGYTIGKVWRDHDRPDPKGVAFPHGTVICKLLFVDVPTEQVPSLVDPVLWQGFVCDNYASHNRSVRPVALIQMDVMIRDDRTPTGWLFGTFQYNGARKSRERWENLVPVGVQWGNDEAVRTDRYFTRCPERTEIVREIKESAINEDRDELPPTHLGDGPVLRGGPAPAGRRPLDALVPELRLPGQGRRAVRSGERLGRLLPPARAEHRQL